MVYCFLVLHWGSLLWRNLQQHFLNISNSSYEQVTLYLCRWLRIVLECRCNIPSASCICVGLFWTTPVTIYHQWALWIGNYRKGEIYLPIFVAMWERLNSWLHLYQCVLYKYHLPDQFPCILLQWYSQHPQKDLSYLYLLHL